MGLRKLLDNIERHFQEGGRLQNYYALYEVFDTFLYVPGSVTRSTAHVQMSRHHDAAAQVIILSKSHQDCLIYLDG